MAAPGTLNGMDAFIGLMVSHPLPTIRNWEPAMALKVRSDILTTRLFGIHHMGILTIKAGTSGNQIVVSNHRRTLLEAKVIDPEIAGLDTEGTEVEFHGQYR